MGGGLMQLVAFGAQDTILTGSPQVTFFKQVYRRHTAFAMESIEQVFNGAADWGRKVTVTISRNGDLIQKAYVVATLPDVWVPAGTNTTSYCFRWLDWVGHLLVQYADFEIGGQRIDRCYGEWLQIWHELTCPASQALGYANLVGHTPDLTFPTVTWQGDSGATPPVAPSPTTLVKGKTLYVPLRFWWCENPGLAIPLIACQYHEVKISIQFAAASDCYYAGTSTDAGQTWSPITGGTQSWLPGAGGGNGISPCSLFVDFVYLDTEERRRFAQVSHEYLVRQIQFTGSETATGVNPKIKMAFNHPCLAVYWTVQPNGNTTEDEPGTDVSLCKFGKQAFNYTDAPDTTISDLMLQAMPGSTTTIPILKQHFTTAGSSGGHTIKLPVNVKSAGNNPVVKARIQLNGHDRISERDGRYFNLMQPLNHHESIPRTGINMYSFALKPEEAQPSGSVNMSRIDSATLIQTLTPATVSGSGSCSVKIYAINYNVLRVMSGMAGLALKFAVYAMLNQVAQRALSLVSAA